MLNGIDVDGIENMNELIGILGQEAFVFNDTLRNNFSMYASLPDEQLIAMLKRLNLHKFATTNALDQEIREGGANLSGGEKKRIALARILLRDFPILVLDEPLANIDGESIHKIEDIILQLQDKSVFVVTHHFDAAKQFDHIIQMG